MITEAEIKSINFASNSCTVRIPYFETLNTPEKIIIPARFVSLPGICSGYAVGDYVWVAFGDGLLENPIVIGKIFKNATEEAKSGGAISCENFVAKKAAAIPLETVIQNSDSDFDSITKIINNIKSLQVEQETLENYSLSPKVYDPTTAIEQQVGQWVDSKIIYRKTFIYTDEITADTDTLIGDIGYAIDTVVKIDKVIRNSDTPHWFVNDYTENIYIKVKTDGTVYVHSVNEGWPTPKLIVSIEYTKA